MSGRQAGIEFIGQRTVGLCSEQITAGLLNLTARLPVTVAGHTEQHTAQAVKMGQLRTEKS